MAPWPSTVQLAAQVAQVAAAQAAIDQITVMMLHIMEEVAAAPQLGHHLVLPMPVVVDFKV